MGWYVEPSMKHYRCIQCYFPRTRYTRNCDIIEFFPHATTFPQFRLKAFLTQAASDIVALLTQTPSTAAPSLQAGYPVRNALLTLAHLLKQTDELPDPSSSQPTVTDTLRRENTPLPRVEHESLPRAMNSNVITKQKI